jgi:general secretion pathway protein D
VRAAGPVVVLAALSWGCASAYQQGVKAGKQGDWDVAVAKLTKAAAKDPDSIKVKIALESARVRASEAHYKEAKKQLAADSLDAAVQELEIASRFDPGNLAAAEDLRITKDRVRRREEEKRRLSEFDAMKTRAQAVRVPAPVLSPRSPVLVSMKYPDQSLQKIFEALGKLAGVNIVFDESYRDKRVDFNVTGITFEEALEQLTFVNRLFYKVVDQNTLIIVQESAAKRRQFDDRYVQTFYLQNAEAQEMMTLVGKVTGLTNQLAANQSLNAITLTGTPDQLAFAQKVIEANDKAKGEVLVEVEILEVNRTTLKKYGIDLSNYEGSVTFSPTGAPNEVSGGFTTVRAQLLSSLNLSDFIVSLPSTLTARFLRTESSVRLLASPKLRAAEGKKTNLKIGTDVPIPVTTFTSNSPGTTTFAPATSFQYKTVGVTLDITPKVSAGGEIALELAAEFSNLGDNVSVGGGVNPLIVPTFLTRAVNGVLRLRDGETTLLGGLITSRDAASMSGALGLSSIPVLGKLLGGHQRQNDNQEILLSITPHIVRGPKVTEEDLKTLNVGSQDLPKVFGARPPLFGLAEEPSPSPSASPAATAAPTAPPSSPPPTPAPTPQALAAPPAAGAPGQPAPIDVGTAAAPAPKPTTAAAPAEAVSAVIRPGTLSLRAGENGVVDVVVLGGAREVISVDLVVTFDPTLLEAIEALPGALLTLGDVSVGAERSLEPGRARVRFTRQLATSGAGAVASIRLKALRPGAGSISVQSLTLISATGTTTSVAAPRGRVSVSAP